MKPAAFMFALACSAALGACSSAQTPPASAAAGTPEVASSAAPADPMADPDRMICKNVIPTGSRIGKRTCMTARNWNQAQKDARDAVDQVQRNSMQTGVKGG
jgi:hypothetical protein